MSKSSALFAAPAEGSASAGQWTPPCVCIDIETPVTNEAILHKIAAFRPDTGASISFQGKFSPADVKARLDVLTTGAEFVLGHNIRRHDLPVLAQLYPELALTNLPVIDTLELSPLAFPENPYHRLVKDYKLVSDARNHPLRDAELSLQLFREELQAFEVLCRTRPDEIALFHSLIGAAPGGVGSLFALVRRAPCPSLKAAAGHLGKAVDGNVCATRLMALVETDLSEPSLHHPIAYLVAWLRVAGGTSVLPPWVHRTFPETGRLIRELRDVPCGSPECAYCRTAHDPEALLARNFNLSAFRPQPQNDAGGSLQRDVTVAGLRGENLIAILPTGAGKSVCYQLPALAHYWRTVGKWGRTHFRDSRPHAARTPPLKSRKGVRPQLPNTPISRVHPATVR